MDWRHGGGFWWCPLCLYRIQSDVFDLEDVEEALYEHELAHAGDGPKIGSDIIAAVQAIAAEYEIPGLDYDDIVQEGLIATLEAYKNFDPSRGVPFLRFVDRVVRLRLYDVLTAATRKKHEVLNQAIVVVVGDDGQDVELLKVLADPSPFVERVVLARERLEEIIEEVRSGLTDLERSAIVAVLNGDTYAKICADFCVNRRQVDNAVQRARRKLR